jgi:hypothetical protein
MCCSIPPYIDHLPPADVKVQYNQMKRAKYNQTNNKRKIKCTV